MGILRKWSPQTEVGKYGQLYTGKRECKWIYIDMNKIFLLWRTFIWSNEETELLITSTFYIPTRCGTALSCWEVSISAGPPRSKVCECENDSSI